MTAASVFKVVRAGVTLAVLVGGAIYIYRHSEDLSVLTEISLLEMLSLAAAMFVVFLVTGYTFYLLVSMLSTELHPIEWIGLTFLTNALNYLGPTRPGMIAKAAYLKKKTTLSYSRFSSIMAANFFLFLLISGLTGLIALLLLQPTGGGGSLLLTVCVVLILATFTPFVVPLFRFQIHNRVTYLLNNALQGFDEIRSQRGKMLQVGIAVLVQHLLSAVCYVIAFRALGFDIDGLIAITLVGFVAVANALAITPNSIGIQEMVMASVYSIVGLDFADGLLSAALIRAVHLLLTFSLEPIFLVWMLNSAKLSLSSLWTSAED